MNDILEKLPKHLLSLVIDQPYNDYTAQDHAVWRYVMRQNVDFLSKVAHGSYLDGLRKTGISINEIPHMYGMNRILREIGWAAVAVDGFIPPTAFMEFQAYNVLVIAADIRPVHQIEYTPAPDIIHEAAGHAPIIADMEYASYLKKFGEIGSKAFSSARDYQVYEAVRHLSILKADPYTLPDDIAKAETKLQLLEKVMGEPSEMCLIRNLHWWTVEYGLIGDLKKPKIYGAGLLSSIGESYSCLKDDVKKIPYTIDAVNYGFDITTRQPQLFVTPDFENLTTVLNQFTERMALKRGGLYGIKKAIESENIATVVYSSGLQVSGTFTGVKTRDEIPFYIQTTGPTQLCCDNEQLTGHGKNYHQQGFGSPIGKFRRCATPPELLTVHDLENLGIAPGKNCEVTFESGVVVSGVLEKAFRIRGKNLIFTFTDCTVKLENEILFEPSWGKFDMAVGEKISSAFAGPADPDSFGLSYPAPIEKTHKIAHTQAAKKLHGFYNQVRKTRNNGASVNEFPMIFEVVKKEYPDEWLLPLEMLEINSLKGLDDDFANKLKHYLLSKKDENNSLENLINNGLNLIEKIIE